MVRTLPLLMALSCTSLVPSGGTRPDPTDSADPFAVQIPPSVPDLGAFPLPIDGELVVDASFGPRHLSSRERDDWHQGIDIPGELGDAVRAIAPGRVHRVHPADGEGDGNTLYTVHEVAPFTWHGVELDRFFVQYGHLDSFALDEDDPVEAGTIIGTMGNTSARHVHVHVEIRLGGHCSYRYQVRNPDSSCGFGFDPSVHPFHLFQQTEPGGVEVDVRMNDPLVVRVRVPVDDSDLSRIETDLGVLDFDLKQGIDASSKAAMDDLDHDWVRIVPTPFDSEATHHSWDLHFAEPPQWVQATDVYGVGRRVPVSDP